MKLSPDARRAAAAAVMSASTALLLAACGSSGTPASAPAASGSSSSSSAAASPAQVAAAHTSGSPNSCTVITQSEASAALGQHVQPPRRGKAKVEEGVACVFYGPDVPPGTSPNDAGLDAVRVVLVTGPNAKKYSRR